MKLVRTLILLLIFTKTLSAASIFVSPSLPLSGEVIQMAIKSDPNIVSVTGKFLQNEVTFNKKEDGNWYVQIPAQLAGYHRLDIIQNHLDSSRKTTPIYLMIANTAQDPELEKRIRYANQQALSLQLLISTMNRSISDWQASETARLDELNAQLSNETLKSILSQMQKEHDRLVIENADLTQLVKLLREASEMLYRHNAVLADLSTPFVQQYPMPRDDRYRVSSLLESPQAQREWVAQSIERLASQQALLKTEFIWHSATQNTMQNPMITSENQAQSAQIDSAQIKEYVQLRDKAYALVSENAKLRHDQLEITLLNLDLENFRQDFASFYSSDSAKTGFDANTTSLSILQRELFRQNQAIDQAMIQLTRHRLTQAIFSFKEEQKTATDELHHIHAQETKLRELLNALSDTTKKKVQDQNS